MHLRFLLILSLLLCHLASFCQDITDTIGPKELEKVIVTANRRAEAEKKVAASVETLSKNQMQQFGPRTTPEALQLLNGVYVQRTNHGGGSPFVRGVTGNQLLILVDGIRLNNSTYRYGPNQYLNTVDAFIVQHIEVAKGTGSVQYGSDAMGGTIQVFTHDAILAEDKNKWTGLAVGRMMTGGMEKTLRGEGAYSGKNMAAIAGLTYRNFGDIIGGDTTGKQVPSGYEEWAFDAKLKFRLSRGTQLIIAHQQVEQQEVPVYHKIVLENFDINEMDPQKRILSYAKTITRFDDKVFKSLEIIGSYQLNKEVRKIHKKGSTLLRQETDEVNTLGLSVDLLTQTNRNWMANSGVELYYDKVNSSRFDLEESSEILISRRGLYPDNSSYGNYSVYSLHEYELNKWTFNAGIRFNQFSIRVTDSALGEITLSPSAWVGNAGISYQLGKFQHLFISVNSAFRAPNIDDLGSLGIVDFRYEIPTSGLQPEKSLNYEVGYKLRADKLHISASVYYMQMKNIIARVRADTQTIAGYPVYKKENTESAYIYGGEGSLQWTITDRFRFYSGISYTFGQNQTRDEPMRRIPPLNGRVSLSYSYHKWFAAAEWMAASSQERLAQGDKDDNRIPAGGTPGWNVVNLYAGYQLTHLNLNLGFQNVFNEDYRTHGSGINGYGRSVWISLLFKI